MSLKTILTTLFICIVSLMYGQREYHSAIGVRVGIPHSISYKQFLDMNNAMELTIGRRSKNTYSYTNLTLGYQIHEKDVDDFVNWYYGIGGDVYINSYKDTYESSRKSSVAIGLHGSLGLDYKFDDLPINLGVEWRPSYGLGNSPQKGIRLDNFGIIARYVLTND